MKKKLSAIAGIEINFSEVVDLDTEIGKECYEAFLKMKENIEEAMANFEKDMREELRIIEDDEYESLNVIFYVVDEEDIEEDSKKEDVKGDVI